MRLFLNSILDLQLFPEFNSNATCISFNQQKIDFLVRESNEEVEKYFQRDKFKSDLELLKLPLEDLIRKVSFADLQNYSFLNGVFLSSKKPRKKLKLRIQGKDFIFRLDLLHKNFILLTKNKRLDEYVKLGFKYIKRQLLKSLKKQKPSLSHKAVKTLFLKEFLSNDPKLASLFQKAEPTKGDFGLIKKNPELFGKITSLVKDRFLFDMIKEKVVGPSAKIFETGLSCKVFLKHLFGLQQRKSLSLQDAITCFDFMSVMFRS